MPAGKRLRACESDAGSCGDSDDEDLCLDGPWVVNNNTAWYHKAVLVAERDLCFNAQCWGLACRPTAKLLASYRVLDTHASFQGFACCGHSGCRV